MALAGRAVTELGRRRRTRWSSSACGSPGRSWCPTTTRAPRSWSPRVVREVDRGRPGPDRPDRDLRRGEGARAGPGDASGRSADRPDAWRIDRLGKSRRLPVHWSRRGVSDPCSVRLRPASGWVLARTGVWRNWQRSGLQNRRLQVRVLSPLPADVRGRAATGGVGRGVASAEWLRGIGDSGRSAAAGPSRTVVRRRDQRRDATRRATDDRDGGRSGREQPTRRRTPRTSASTTSVRRRCRRRRLRRRRAGLPAAAPPTQVARAAGVGKDAAPSQGRKAERVGLLRPHRPVRPRGRRRAA